MSDATTEYWKDCIVTALDELNISLTHNEVDHLVGAVEGAHENYGMEEISNKIRSGEPVGFLEAIAAINYQATLKAARQAAEAETLRGRLKRWLRRKTGWLRAS